MKEKSLLAVHQTIPSLQLIPVYRRKVNYGNGVISHICNGGGLIDFRVRLAAAVPHVIRLRYFAIFI